MRPDEEMANRINDGERKYVEEQETKLLAWMLEQPWTREECLAKLARAWIQLERTLRFADLAEGLVRRHNIIDQQIADMQEREPGRIGRLVELLELDIPSTQTKALSVAVKAGKRQVPASGGSGQVEQKQARLEKAFEWCDEHIQILPNGRGKPSFSEASVRLGKHLSKSHGTAYKYIITWRDQKVGKASAA